MKIGALKIQQIKHHKMSVGIIFKEVTTYKYTSWAQRKAAHS